VLREYLFFLLFPWHLKELNDQPKTEEIQKRNIGE